MKNKSQLQRSLTSHWTSLRPSHESHLQSVVGDIVVPWASSRQPGVKVIVSVDDDDDEVGEEDEDVGEDVADDEEGPGVDHVGLAGS